MRLPIIPAFAVAGLIGITSHGAAAAPQVLAMMSSDEPISFTCGARECYALASTFCLQRDRDIPVHGQPYDPNLPERLKVSFIGESGTVTELDAAAAGLRFQGYSGYTMVRISLPREALDHLGATAVALQIGPGVSLVPQPRVGDSDPQSPAEIATATGAMRIAAARYLDAPTVRGDSARLVAALINGLPEQRTIHDRYDGLWERAIGGGLTQQVDPEALRQAEHSYQTCMAVDTGGLRQCLLSQHRQLMTEENRTFWEDTGGY